MCRSKERSKERSKASYETNKQHVQQETWIKDGWRGAIHDVERKVHGLGPRSGSKVSGTDVHTCHRRSRAHIATKASIHGHGKKSPV